MSDEIKAIRASARTFDLDSDPNEETQQYIDEANGDQDATAAQDAEVSDGMPLDAAVKIVTMAQDETFQFFCEIQSQLQAKYLVESKRFNVTSDHRTFHANLAQGIEQSRLLWGQRIAEATERLQRATAEERRQLNTTVQRVLDSAAPIEERATGKPLFIDGELVSTLPGMNVVAAEAAPRRS